MIPNVALSGICAAQFGQLTSTPVLPGGYDVAALAIHSRLQQATGGGCHPGVSLNHGACLAHQVRLKTSAW
jgi:hypothetical protein